MLILSTFKILLIILKPHESQLGVYWKFGPHTVTFVYVVAAKTVKYFSNFIYLFHIAYSNLLLLLNSNMYVLQIVKIADVCHGIIY